MGKYSHKKSHKCLEPPRIDGNWNVFLNYITEDNTTPQNVGPFVVKILQNGNYVDFQISEFIFVLNELAVWTPIYKNGKFDYWTLRVSEFNSGASESLTISKMKHGKVTELSGSIIVSGDGFFQVPTVALIKFVKIEKSC